MKEDNYEENFLFGLDANAPINDNKDPDLIKNRVVQIGGKLVRNEYYGDVDENLKNRRVAKFQTRTEMLEARKLEQ